MVTFTMKTYLHFRRVFFFFQAEDGIRDADVTGVQTCALFFSSRRRHTRCGRDWSSDVCSSDLHGGRHQPVDRAYLAAHRVQLRRALGYFRYCPTKSSTFSRSMRNTPPVPPHVPFNPNEVTPAITLLVPR